MSAVDEANTSASGPPADGSASAVIAFLGYTVEKGYLKAATANAMKVAVREVLSAAEGEDWDRLDVRELDLEDVVRRFETLRAMKYKPESLHTYAQRFTNAVGMYQDFVAAPRTWRPTVRTRTARGGRIARPSAASGAGTVSPTSADTASPSAEPRPSEGMPMRTSLIPYPFPLRDGVLVTLHLPADLTRREASRLVAFVQSLAVDSRPEETVSSEDG